MSSHHSSVAHIPEKQIQILRPGGIVSSCTALCRQVKLEKLQVFSSVDIKTQLQTSSSPQQHLLS